MFSRGVTVPPASSLWGVRAACSVAVETAVQRDSPLAEPAHQVRGERFRNRKAIWRDFQKELLVQGCHYNTCEVCGHAIRDMCMWSCVCVWSCCTCDVCVGHVMPCVVM